jgi:hypothetical protein
MQKPGLEFVHPGLEFILDPRHRSQSQLGRGALGHQRVPGGAGYTGHSASITFADESHVLSPAEHSQAG